MITCLCIKADINKHPCFDQIVGWVELFETGSAAVWAVRIFPFQKKGSSAAFWWTA